MNRRAVFPDPRVRDEEGAECARDLCDLCAANEPREVHRRQDPQPHYVVVHRVRIGPDNPMGDLVGCGAGRIHLRRLLAERLGFTSPQLRSMGADHMDQFGALLDLPNASGDTARRMLHRGDLDGAIDLLAPGARAVRAARGEQ